MFADQGRSADAAALCEQSLREAGPSAPAFFLLGMIRQSEGDATAAEALFQKTAYLDPQHDEALLALALIAERRGDSGAASGYRRRAARAHRRKGSA
jgi:chemotaxis protein methyltransferase WspC